MSWQHAILSKKKEKIEHILDKKIIHTWKGEYNKYLVLLEGLAPIECKWIMEGDLINLDPIK